MLRNKALQFLTGTLTLAVVSLGAVETDTEDRVVVGERSLEPKVAMEIHGARRLEINEGKEEEQAKVAWVECSEHWGTSIDRTSGFVELEDGSYWSVRPSHSNSLWQWDTYSDRLFLTQNPTRWFSGYQYRLVNATTWTYVDANLILSPVLGNPYTLQVMHMPISSDSCTLTDGTFWLIYGSDIEISSRWLAGDLIIVGRNDDTYTKESYPYVLINVNMDEWVRAQ